METQNSSVEQGSSEKLGLREEPGSSEDVRNWLELPPDVMSLIFIKLGPIDIILRAQSVCSSWLKLSKEPHLFRSIDMRNRWDIFEENEDNVEKLAMEAVDRSCGQLVELSVEHFATDVLIQYVTNIPCPLKCLRLVSCYHVSDQELINLAQTFPALETLEICHCSFSEDMLKAVGQACPQLKSFRLNCRGFRRPHIECDEEALTIANNMPELRHLHLFGNKLTNDGLNAILNGCPHLESLDLRQCFNIDLKGDMLKRCREKLVKLRLPNDPTDDYEFDAVIDGDGSFDEDYPSGFSEIDFLSDDGYYEFSEGSYFSDYDFDGYEFFG